MTSTEKRLSKATTDAYNALIDGTGGNSAEVLSCVATLFVEVMRKSRISDKDAMDALKYTFEMVPKKTNH
jgi:hypothetical protein